MPPLSCSTVRERYLEVRERAGSHVTVVVATKYVPFADLRVLVEAGIEVVGENRAQDLAAKHAATATRSAGTSSAISSRTR